jgi:ketosteroid isomerase-like protein
MNSRVLIALVVLGVSVAGRTEQAVSRGAGRELSEADRAAITSLLTGQQAAWNRADVKAFMQGYWNSPELTFAGSNGITRGWEPVLARYEKQYPDQAAMGRLDFSELEMRSLGPDAALVLGRWHLTRQAGNLGGVYSLVFERFAEGWRIVHDHTSSDATPH